MANSPPNPRFDCFPRMLSRVYLGPWSPKKVRTPTCPMLLRPNTIYKWDLHYEQAVRKTASFFRLRNYLGEIGFYRETMDF
nr:hypothetical protein Ahy_B10g102999 [Ipomoea batatas]GMD96882.1 hypothetical protein Ahy_B10g102999 [Ipomoea batatas]